MPDSAQPKLDRRAKRLAELAAHGQSCWLDDLSRRMVVDGHLQQLVESGISGVTANPATFGKAISEGSEYARDIADFAGQGFGPDAIYERLAVADIRDACDILRPVYDATSGVDGFVSLEVSPHLAHDTQSSIEEGQRLWAAVDRPNLFIKIPGTRAGLPAIEELLVQGINVNVTLLFSVERYEAVADAYLRALERRRTAGRPIDRIASVASFFLSRIDVLVDQLLQHRIVPNRPAAAEPNPAGLLGKTAVANAKLAYHIFQRITAGDRWRSLAGAGAQVQRLLWASTGTKNPHYSELMYVEPLIGRDTVNTMPEKTIAAFIDHGTVRGSVDEGVDEARRIIADLGRLGVDFPCVATQLENEGVQKFIEPFDALMEHIGRAGRGAR